MPGQTFRLVLRILAVEWLLFASMSHSVEAGQCDEINIQTAAENRLKFNELSKRGVAIFFAGASVNALPASEKRAVEAELDRFFAAFHVVYTPTAYFWSANRELVEQKQVRFDYLVVVDAEMNAGSLPKYNEFLTDHKGKLIDDDMLAIVDYTRPGGKQTTPPYAFIQISDVGPLEAYVMFAEWSLLFLGVDLNFHAGKDYYAQISEFVSGEFTDPSAVNALRRTHEMIVYDCLAPAFKQ